MYGLPVEGKDCMRHGNMNCGYCAFPFVLNYYGGQCSCSTPGYHSNDGGCDPYKCICPNGTPVVGSGYGNQVCNKNGRERCESCDDGFELDCSHKYKNICTCIAKSN